MRHLAQPATAILLSLTLLAPACRRTVTLTGKVVEASSTQYVFEIKTEPGIEIDVSGVAGTTDDQGVARVVVPVTAELAVELERGEVPSAPASRLWDGNEPTTMAGWVALGRRVFFEYPMRAEVYMEWGLTKPELAAAVGIERESPLARRRASRDQTTVRRRSPSS